MGKISRHAGMTDATVNPPEDIEPLADDELEADAVEDEVLERPAVRATRADWLAWAAAAGYTSACVDALTVPGIQALPDGPPVYDDDGLLVAPDGASDETKDALEIYNAKAIELFGETAPQVAAGEAEGSDAEVVGADEEA